MSKKPTDENKVLTLVKSAKPVNKAGEVDPFRNHRIGDLAIENRILIKHHKDRNGNPIKVSLFMNGSALIEREIVADDGIEEKRLFVMIGITAKGERLPPTNVPVSQFPAMNWVLQWGNKLVHAPGNGNKDNARAAIQVLSGDVETQYVYRHTGWRKIDGQWLYLHGGGAIGADGHNEQICVELDPGNMQRYQLPAPDKKTQHYATLLLDLLSISPSNPAIGAALACAVCLAPLGEAVEINFALFFAGLTGSLKSSAASLALGFFGDFVEVGGPGHFPCSFLDSALDIAIKGHSAAHTVIGVDEFNPNSLSSS